MRYRMIWLSIILTVIVTISSNAQQKIIKAAIKSGANSEMIYTVEYADVELSKLEKYCSENGITIVKKVEVETMHYDNFVNVVSYFQFYINSEHDAFLEKKRLEAEAALAKRKAETEARIAEEKRAEARAEYVKESKRNSDRERLIAAAKEKWKEYKIEIKYYDNGNIYIGQLKNGLRNGNGTYIYKPSGEQDKLTYYEGAWLNDKKNGWGRLTRQALIKDGFSSTLWWYNEYYGTIKGFFKNDVMTGTFLVSGKVLINGIDAQNFDELDCTGLVINEDDSYTGSIRNLSAEERETAYKQQQCQKCEIDRNKTNFPAYGKSGTLYMKNGYSVTFDFDKDGNVTTPGFIFSTNEGNWENFIKRYESECKRYYCK